MKAVRGGPFTENKRRGVNGKLNEGEEVGQELAMDTKAGAQQRLQPFDKVTVVGRGDHRTGKMRG